MRKTLTFVNTPSDLAEYAKFDRIWQNLVGLRGHLKYQKTLLTQRNMYLSSRSLVIVNNIFKPVADPGFPVGGRDS